MKQLLAIIVILACTTCVQRVERKVGPTLDTIDRKPAFLKAHMRNGDLYVLDTWTIHENEGYLEGDGRMLGTDRNDAMPRGHFRIAFADVALYESNTIVSSPSLAAVTIVTGLVIAGSVACITTPKACFGSCPTFYAPTDDGHWMLQAEGFSDAIAPILEDHDIDALWRTTGHPGAFTLRMTNEAYETHVVKQADVLAVPRPHGGRVLATGEQLWVASQIVEPRSCRASEGDCLRSVRAVDGDERTSLTDPDDLAAREVIDLDFAPPHGRVAIVIGARQTLVTTFLLYQGLAYLGDTVGHWVKLLDDGDPVAHAGGRALENVIGGIEVQLATGGDWETAGKVYETGPLATDVHTVLLPEGADATRVRLRMPRGGWRLDYVALAAITGEATPIRIAPSAIRGSLGPEYAAGRTPATSFPIVTQPGDQYELTYQLPAAGELELFLDSRGYYLEWMRSEWLSERNPLAALHMLTDPARAARELAPAFKRIEPHAEALFWSSRYARP